jgi:lysophospholipase L1-like esterase
MNNSNFFLKLNKKNNIFLQTAIFCSVLIVSLAGAEVVLRYKNSDGANYNIEMWKYSNELKDMFSDQGYEFKHKLNSSFKLQNVEIRTNNFGLRGSDISEKRDDKTRILFLGGSVTLGWGVSENQTTPFLLEKTLKASDLQVEVLNAGVGNYNVQRYTSLFFDELVTLKPDHIVLNFFIRDMEDLPKPNSNFLLRNSQIAVTLWIAYQQLFNKFNSESQYKFYKDIYSKKSKEFSILDASFERFKEYGQSSGATITVAMIPEIKFLDDYKLGFAHELLKTTASRHGFNFIDLFPSLETYSSKELFVMHNDPHPNRLGHKKMAKDIANFFEQLLLNEKR